MSSPEQSHALQRSISSKEVAEVAAATRFRLELERLEEFESTNFNASIQKWSTHNNAEAAQDNVSTDDQRSVHSAISDTLAEHRTEWRRRRIHKPPPLLLSASAHPQEMQSARLQVRTSSKAYKLDPDQDASHHMVQTHRRRITVAENIHSIQSTTVATFPADETVARDVPLVPSLAPSVPTATTSHFPPSPFSMCAPNEDQIRREMEVRAVHDNGVTLERQKLRRKPVKMSVRDFDDESEEPMPRKSMSKRPDPKPQPEAQPEPPASSDWQRIRRRKSIFSIFQRQPSLNDLIDLYMNDEQLAEEYGPQKKPSKSRRMTLLRKSSSVNLLPEKTPPEKPPPVPSIKLASAQSSTTHSRAPSVHIPVNHSPMVALSPLRESFH